MPSGSTLATRKRAAAPRVSSCGSPSGNSPTNERSTMTKMPSPGSFRQASPSTHSPARNSPSGAANISLTRMVPASRPL